MLMKAILLPLALIVIFSTSTALSIPDQHVDWRSEDDYYTFISLRAFTGDVLFTLNRGKWYISKHVKSKEICLGTNKQVREWINEYRKGNLAKSRVGKRTVRNARRIP